MKVAIVDFDGTLLPHNTIPFLLNYWKREGLDKKRYWRTMWRILPYYLLFLVPLLPRSIKEKARTGSFYVFNDILDGLSSVEVMEFMEKAGVAVGHALRDTLIEDLVRIKKEGYQTIVLSGAYHPLLVSAVKDAPIDMVWGSTISFEEGVYQARKGLNMIEGKNKAVIVQERLNLKEEDWRDIIAYGDSITDLPLLEKVGYPVMVCPDRRLKKIGDERKWASID